MPSIGTLLGALGNDLFTVDGAQAVKYTAKNPPNPAQVISIPDTVQADLTDDEVVEFANYLIDSVGTKWIFEDNKLVTSNPSPPPATIPSRKPKAGDTLVDASSVTWEILDVDQDSITLAWECVSRRAR